MRKKRILFCSEATFLNTGYATYAREVLTYLHSTGKYEIAELAAYAKIGDPRGAEVPWKFYGTAPADDAPEDAKASFNSTPTNQFGEWVFEDVCLDFLPDIVCDIRDFWMLDFAERSPYRKYFKWCIMPTVDARPQARQWIATYESADACLTYSDWAGKILEDQSGGAINYIGCAPPSAHTAYKPVEDRAKHRVSMGLDPNAKIIGTVMRNQRRKLFPDLFEAFRIYLDKYGDNNTFLYCHTSYPDLGWDIPELIHQNKLSSKVLMTYVCSETKKPFVSLFKGAQTQSPYTGKKTGFVSSVKLGASYEDLANIINTFDVYVQYANSEGFGLPQVEAAACGVPVMSTDYSAMESEVRKLEGIPLKPKALYKELETGCYRAVPDNELAAEEFNKFFSLSEEERSDLSKKTRKAFEEKYQWDITGGMWENYFDSVEIVDPQYTWLSRPRIHQPEEKPAELPPETNANQVVKWLITNVLCEPERLNSVFEARMIRDLSYGSATGTTGGMYFNESSAAFDGANTRQPFMLDHAYEHMKSLCLRRNHWESIRAERLLKR
tara:strand:+ start:3043 stop:4701 length:1659 start_codon:yes stop_codon:yes gene_type:complete